MSGEIEQWLEALGFGGYAEAFAANAGDAEACFERALHISRHQDAKSLELRAATSLARLWKARGETDRARDLLASTYGWFSEGFATRDLRQAKALLNELS